MSLFNVSREINQDGILLKGNIFRGIVIDNNDPLKIGRVKVRIDGIHNDDNNIPWSMNFLNTGCASSVGGLNIPEIGSQVWVLFCSNDLYSTLYIGASYSTDTLPVQDLLEDYPNCKGWSDSSGNVFLFNQTKGFLRVQLVSGASFTFDNNGLTINTNNIGPGINDIGLNINIQGNSNITSTENLNIKAKNINIEATENINIKSNSSITTSCSSYTFTSTTYNVTCSTYNLNSSTSCNFNCSATTNITSSTLSLNGTSVTCNGLSFTQGTIQDTNLAAVVTYAFNCFGGVAIDVAPPQVIPSINPVQVNVDKVDSSMPQPPESRTPYPITVKPNINNFNG